MPSFKNGCIYRKKRGRKRESMEPSAYTFSISWGKNINITTCVWHKHINWALTKQDLREVHWYTKSIRVVTPVWVSNHKYGSASVRYFVNFISSQEVLRYFWLPLSVCKILIDSKINYKALEDLLNENIDKIVKKRVKVDDLKERVEEEEEKRLENVRLYKEQNKNKTDKKDKADTSSPWKERLSKMRGDNIETYVDNETRLDAWIVVEGMDNVESGEDMYFWLLKKMGKSSKAKRIDELDIK